MTWDPTRYLRFVDFRTRPAHDLLARVPTDAPASVVDLGSGPGNATRLLADRWPDADIVGMDQSEAMLERARLDHPDLRFELGDLRDWAPDRPVDVVFSNATLHWIPGHLALLPRLLTHVAPGGSLAMQIPNNIDQPSHAEAHRIVQQHFPDLDGVLSVRPKYSAADHYDALSAPGVLVDVWETTYLQALTGDDPVVDWTSGTFLRPLLRALGDRRDAFLDRYADAMRTAYPPREDGVTLLPFPRLFAVATKR